MHQSTWKSFRDALEMHQKSAEFDMQGCTLTHIHRISEDTSPELVQISHGHTLIWFHPEISVSAETKRQPIPISPKTHIVLHKLGQIDIPYFEQYRICENIHTPFIDLQHN